MFSKRVLLYIALNQILYSLYLCHGTVSYSIHTSNHLGLGPHHTTCHAYILYRHWLLTWSFDYPIPLWEVRCMQGALTTITLRDLL